LHTSIFKHPPPVVDDQKQLNVLSNTSKIEFFSNFKSLAPTQPHLKGVIKMHLKAKQARQIITKKEKLVTDYDTASSCGSVAESPDL
jgi:hypothetical protein